MLNGMLWIVRSGAQWRGRPEAYGPWQSVYARFAKWRDDWYTGSSTSHTVRAVSYTHLKERRLYVNEPVNTYDSTEVC